jgi:hypothetical protein
VPYVDPTAADIQARFPALLATDADVLEALIAEAKLLVDNTWTEGAYRPAIMYLVAHMATREAQLVSAADLVGIGSGQVKSESLGDASVTYETNAAVGGWTGNDAEFASTPYGLRYLALRRANVGGPIVV